MIYGIIRIKRIENSEDDSKDDVEISSKFSLFLLSVTIGVKSQKIILIFFVIQEGFIFFVVTNLLLFHIYLSLKGFTTYDFIIHRREKKKKRDKLNMGEASDICSEDNVMEHNDMEDFESGRTSEVKHQGSFNGNSPSNKYREKNLVIKSKSKGKVGIKLNATNKNSASSIGTLKSPIISKLKAKYKEKYKLKYKEKFERKVQQWRAKITEEVKEQLPSAPKTLEKPKDKHRTLEVSYSKELLPQKMLSDQPLKSKDTSDPLYTATSQNGNQGEIERMELSLK